jgi:hypothetical protein
MKTVTTIFRFMILGSLIFDACSRTGEKEGRAGADTTVYVLNIELSPGAAFFDSLSQKDVLDFLYAPGTKGKNAKDTTFIVDVQFNTLPPEWEDAKDTALLVSVLLSKDNVMYPEDAGNSKTNLFLLQLSEQGLGISWDTVIFESREALADKGMEDPDDYIREEFPVYTSYVKIPENAGEQTSIFGKYSEKDILEFIYKNDALDRNAGEISYITDYKIVTENLVCWTASPEPQVADSCIVMLMTYAPCEPEQVGCNYRYCDLVVLSPENGTLSVIARTDFGPYEEFHADGGGGRQDGLELEFYKIHPAASAIGLHYKYSQGSDLGSEGLEKLDLYLADPVNKEIMPVLSLDMGRSSFEYTGGPEGGSSNSLVVKSEITIAPDMVNGFYRIIRTASQKITTNGEVSGEETSSTTYSWKNSAYIQDEGF